MSRAVSHPDINGNKRFSSFFSGSHISVFVCVCVCVYVCVCVCIPESAFIVHSNNFWEDCRWHSARDSWGPFIRLLLREEPRLSKPGPLLKIC